MTPDKALSIKSWIKGMGFELSKSHRLSHRTRRLKYYTLGNFGVYEEITPKKKSENGSERKQRFISWTPWGDNVVIHSVKDLSKAYNDFIQYNPNVTLN